MQFRMYSLASTVQAPGLQASRVQATAAQSAAPDESITASEEVAINRSRQSPVATFGAPAVRSRSQNQAASQIQGRRSNEAVAPYFVPRPPRSNQNLSSIYAEIILHPSSVGLSDNGGYIRPSANGPCGEAMKILGLWRVGIYVSVQDPFEDTVYRFWPFLKEKGFRLLLGKGSGNMFPSRSDDLSFRSIFDAATGRSRGRRIYICAKKTVDLCQLDVGVPEFNNVISELIRSRIYPAQDNCGGSSVNRSSSVRSFQAPPERHNYAESSIHEINNSSSSSSQLSSSSLPEASSSERASSVMEASGHPHRQEQHPSIDSGRIVSDVQDLDFEMKRFLVKRKSFDPEENKLSIFLLSEDWDEDRKCLEFLKQIARADVLSLYDGLPSVADSSVACDAGGVFREWASKVFEFGFSYKTSGGEYIFDKGSRSGKRIFGKLAKESPLNFQTTLYDIVMGLGRLVGLCLLYPGNGYPLDMGYMVLKAAVSKSIHTDFVPDDFSDVDLEMRRILRDLQDGDTLSGECWLQCNLNEEYMFQNLSNHSPAQVKRDVLQGYCANRDLVATAFIEGFASLGICEYLRMFDLNNIHAVLSQVVDSTEQLLKCFSFRDSFQSSDIPKSDIFEPNSEQTIELLKSPNCNRWEVLKSFKLLKEIFLRWVEGLDPDKASKFFILATGCKQYSSCKRIWVRVHAENPTFGTCSEIIYLPYCWTNATEYDEDLIRCCLESLIPENDVSGFNEV